MGAVTVNIIKALNLKNMDTGFMGKTDAYVNIHSNGQWFNTKTIDNDLNPVWNQKFVCKVDDPNTAVVTFTVFDSDNWTNDDFIGSCSLSMAGLSLNQPVTYNLPLLRRKKEDGWGTLVVELTAVDFSGLMAIANQLSETEKKLVAEVAELSNQIKDLKGEVTKFHEENEKLEAIRKGFEEEVASLKGEVGKFHDENTKLEATREGLEEEVGSLGNKINILSGELSSLQRTREILDVQVSRQEEQNQQLAEELGKLHTIEEGMRSFAAQQGADYAAFVDKLTSSLNQHEKLIHQFSAENDKLKKNRRQIHIDSLLALSNSFSNWDKKVGLSVHEFESYLEMLGSEFQTKLTAKFGGNLQNVFDKLDSDHNGTLNIPELRALLNELVEDEKAQE